MEQFVLVIVHNLIFYMFLKREHRRRWQKLMSKVMLLFRKQCIESEKLFDFLKDPVDQATSMASKKDNRGGSVWPLYR